MRPVGGPTSGLDEIVHQRDRLAILTVAAKVHRAEFGYLLETLALTPGKLSRHISALEDEGLIEVKRGDDGGWPRTWVRITRSGRAALGAELDVLAALLRLRSAVPQPPDPAEESS